MLYRGIFTNDAGLDSDGGMHTKDTQTSQTTRSYHDPWKFRRIERRKMAPSRNLRFVTHIYSSSNAQMKLPSLDEVTCGGLWISAWRAALYTRD